ncbi:MAG: hypothetical protein JOZ88_11090 [Hyphomicrobiales bacterium]|nr:hypothetical protein [Hyphomicrobiales bacterium]
MAHWREILPKGVMIDVRYEDVVADLRRRHAASSRMRGSNGMMRALRSTATSAR